MSARRAQYGAIYAEEGTTVFSEQSGGGLQRCFSGLRLAAQRLLAASESFFRPATVSVPFRFGSDPMRAWPVTLSPAAPVRVFRGVPSFPTPCISREVSSVISSSILKRSAWSPLRASSSSLLLLGISGKI